MNKQITIIGAGIAGLTTAIALAKKGFNSLIFEAAPNIETVGAGLGLGANAIVAFDRLGLRDEVIKSGRNLSLFSIYDQKGKLITKTDSTKMSAVYGVENFTIHRASLHELLLSKINPKVIFTGKRAIDIEHTKEGVLIKFEDGSTHETEFLVAADGIHSAVRKKLLPGSQPRYAGYTCWRAVIDNSGLNLNETSETWGTKGRFGIVPLANKKVYWFACINARRDDADFKNYGVKDILEHFSDFHSPIPTILQESKDENLLWNDIIDLEPIHRYAYNNVLFIGDAAHATTPNMGQGACQAIEDAVVLADELGKNDNIIQAFKNFEKRRMPRTHNITKTSWNIGKIAQLENKVLATLRNFVFRMMPSGNNEKQLRKLYAVDF